MQAVEKISPSLFRLVTHQPHKFGEGHMIPACEAISGHEQREWRCLNCKAIKITVLEGGGNAARREWRIAGDLVQVSDDFRPECSS